MANLSHLTMLGCMAIAGGAWVALPQQHEAEAKEQVSRLLEAVKPGSGANPTVTRTHDQMFERWTATTEIGHDEFRATYNATTYAVRVENESLDRRRYDKRGRVPATLASRQAVQALVNQVSARFWAGSPHDARTVELPFVHRVVARQDDGTLSFESRLMKWNIPYPPCRFTIAADLEEGKILSCHAFLRLPNFPAQAPAQWVTRTAAVAAAFRGPPRWYEGDWAELQWFEPSRGATCKLAWVLTRGKEKVTVDAVNPAVLKRDLYRGVLRNGG